MSRDTRAPVPAGTQPQLTSDEVFFKYYTDNDIFLSPEGILKVLSVVTCIVSSVLFLSSGSCVGAPALVTSSASSALGAGGALMLLAAGRALDLPLRAPRPFLYADIIVPSVAGVLLLVTGVLSMTICEMSGVLDYMHGPLAIAIATMLVGSAALTYFSAMQQWDAAIRPTLERPRPRSPPPELEV